MKKFKLFLIFSFILSGYSCQSLQPVADSEAEVVETFDHSLKKEESFQKSLEWIAKTYSSSQKAIQYQDKGAGKIISRGQMKLSNVSIVSERCAINFDIKFLLKDKRARVVVNNYNGQCFASGMGSSQVGAFRLTKAWANRLRNEVFHQLWTTRASW